jgi:hypothetical protein
VRTITVSAARPARRRAAQLAAQLAGLAVLAVGLAAGCGGEPKPRSLRQLTDSYLFTITPDQAPPHAREDVMYKILVRDRKSREPIETGEGQIFANNRDGASTWDGLTKGPEIGTYYGKLNFVTSGEWAVAIRFRRDSTAKIERTDWMQDVLAERETTPP